MTRYKYYALHCGDTESIYTDWDECKDAMANYPQGHYRSFMTRAEAEEWLAVASVHPLSLMPASKTEYTRTDPTPMKPSARQLQDSERTLITNASGIAKQEVNPAVNSNLLSPEQCAVLELVKAGKSVFFTGSAGTGKSFLLRAIIAYLKERHGTYTSSFGITASTGIAAVNIGGSTLHSWSGIKLGHGTAKQIADRLLFHFGSFAARDRWQACETLIIDEISMIDGKLFDKLEEIGRRVRQNDLPFGGIQLVISGDFAQLPPVPDIDTKLRKPLPVTFAFEAKTWNQCVAQPVVLKKVFRQRNQDFVDILNDMRFAQLNTEAIAVFTSLSRRVTYTDGIEPTELYATRKEVASANTQRLAAIKGREREYHAMDIPGYQDDGTLISPGGATKLLDRLVAVKVLPLKVGAQVMLIKNMGGSGLVNGSLGVVIDYWTPKQAKEAGTWISDEYVDQMKQAKEVKREEPGVRGDVGVLYPLVKFTNGQNMLCAPDKFETLNGAGQVEACRRQIPLILAWALSMHKSQGQTLERVKVNLASVFEKGQAYVALSRATTMEGLEVLHFSPQKVQAHPKVVRWYARLMGIHLRVPVEDDEQDMSDEESLFDQTHGDW